MTGHFSPERIVAARTKAGLLQKDLAAQLHISPVHLSRVETGKRPCSRDLAEKIADIFGVPVWSLYRDVPEDLILTEMEKDLLVRFRRLSEADKGRLLGYLDGMPGGYGDARELTAEERREFRHSLRRRRTRSGSTETGESSAGVSEGAAASDEPPQGRHPEAPAGA